MTTVPPSDLSVGCTAVGKCLSFNLYLYTNTKSNCTWTKIIFILEYKLPLHGSLLSTKPDFHSDRDRDTVNPRGALPDRKSIETDSIFPHHSKTFIYKRLSSTCDLHPTETSLPWDNIGSLNVNLPQSFSGSESTVSGIVKARALFSYLILNQNQTIFIWAEKKVLYFVTPNWKSS